MISYEECCEKYIGDFIEPIRKLLYNYMKDWNIISKSPYSHSYYNSDDISWGYKPENSYRISNHWNFYSRGKIHCKMENENFNDKFMLCQYKDGMYYIVKVLQDEMEKLRDEYKSSKSI